MEQDKRNNNSAEEEKLPATGTGNASNPTVTDSPRPGSQLLDEKAETYLREAGNIEDMPDEKDMQDLDETFRDS